MTTPANGYALTDPAEVATVLAALRSVQTDIVGFHRQFGEEEQFGNLLDADGIDALCEKINIVDTNAGAADVCQIIYDSYPDNELLSSGAPYAGESARDYIARVAETNDDTLFLFLLRELHNMSRSELDDTMSQVLHDVQAVWDGLRKHWRT